MNQSHLGDSLDAWKGWLFKKAAPELRHLTVVPMLTDASGQWQAAHIRLYAKMVRVPSRSVIMRHVQFTHDSRAAYFGGVATISRRLGADLFLDPDTGIWRSNGGKARKKKKKKKKKENSPSIDVSERYVKTCEIGQLLQAENVVLVYRQSNEKIDAIATSMAGYTEAIDNECRAFGIRGGTVTLVAFSRSYRRLNRLRHLFVSAFRPMQADRVTDIR